MTLPVNSRFNLKGDLTIPMQYLPVVLKAILTHNENGVKPLFAVQDGDIVLEIWNEVTIIWDGDGTVNLGDGGNAAGFAADGSLIKGTLGYHLYQSSNRGVYLWDNVAGEKWQKIYTGADTIDATIVTGTSTQGAMTVWALVLRLK